METNADWSPFDGWQLAGFSRTTLSRGEVIVDDYEVVGRAGRGKWLPRTTAGLHASSTPTVTGVASAPLSPARPIAAQLAGAS
jgi:hypothetical protein